jgi:chloride channel protein, CIC family
LMGGDEGRPDEPPLSAHKPDRPAAAVDRGGGLPSGVRRALGSLIAQFLQTTADERKTLLVAGAAGGMAATFNAPLASILLAVELLLFEWRPRSYLPVATSVAVATIVRGVLLGTGAVFAVPHVAVFMIGGALGALEAHLFPAVAPGFWALIGLAAVVGGVMRSPLTGIVFSLELTHEWGALLALIIASAAAFGLSALLLKRSVLTEKIAPRDVHLTREYSIDPLEVLFVRDVMRTDVVLFRSGTLLHEAAATFVTDHRQRRDAQHQQRLYPLLDGDDRLVGVLTRRDMLDAALSAGDDDHAVVDDVAVREPVLAHSDLTLREMANLMAEHGVTRLPVVRRDLPHTLLGLVTLVDLLRGRLIDLQEERISERTLHLREFIPLSRGLRAQREQTVVAD